MVYTAGKTFFAVLAVFSGHALGFADQNESTASTPSDTLFVPGFGNVTLTSAYQVAVEKAALEEEKAEQGEKAATQKPRFELKRKSSTYEKIETPQSSKSTDPAQVEPSTQN